eukprot:jgi/Astpho2/1776/Aster-07538
MSCEGNAQELSDGVAARRTTWKVTAWSEVGGPVDTPGKDPRLVVVGPLLLSELLEYPETDLPLWKLFDKVFWQPVATR